jgi:chemotaxis protein methyltransferase CheR
MAAERALPGQLRPGEPTAALTADNYSFLQGYVERESGISLGADKLYLLKSRLQPLVEQERLKSLDELCARLQKAPSEALRRKVVESMTTHETLFFRDPAVFDMLRNELLPEIARTHKSDKTLRIWCAACSSGQEPYSLAMLLLESGYGDWNIRILGTDISRQILERAAEGKYLQIEINRGLAATLLVKYFQRAGLDWQLKDQVRRMVQFAPFDLRQSPQTLGTFDLILCRNVLIYFEMDTRKKILAGFRGCLVPGAYLLLGASETTLSLDESFLRKPVGSSIVYQMPPAGGGA